MWENLIWTFCFGVPIFIGGLAMSLNPPEFTVARICFIIAIFVVLARISWWISIEHQFENKTVILLISLIFLILGSFLGIGLQWISGRELIAKQYLKIEDTAKPGISGKPTPNKEGKENNTEPTDILQVAGMDVQGDLTPVSSSEPPIKLSLTVRYEQKGKKRIHDIFTCEVIEALPSNSDTSFLRASRAAAKLKDARRKTKGHDLGIDQQFSTSSQFFLQQDDAAAIQKGQMKLYVFLYGSWKDAQNRIGTLEECRWTLHPDIGNPRIGKLFSGPINFDGYEQCQKAKPTGIIDGGKP